MKDVNIIEALFEKYSDGELVHYVTKQMTFLANSIKKDSSPENMYKQMGAILQLAEYLKAIDGRMNRIEKTPTIA